MRKTTKSPGEKIVKDIKRATRKHYSSEEKIRIVLDGLRGEDSIAEPRHVLAQPEYAVGAVAEDVRLNHKGCDLCRIPVGHPLRSQRLCNEVAQCFSFDRSVFSHCKSPRVPRARTQLCAA